MSKLTQDDIDLRLQELRDRDIATLDKYENAMKKVRFLCLKPVCGHTWTTAFVNVYNKKSGCPKCAGYYIDSKQRMEILRDKGFELLEKYKGSDKRHKTRCLKDGYIWNPKFNWLWQGKGCPECAGKVIDIDARLESLRERNIELLEPYKTASEKHWFGCLVESCDCIWNVLFSNVYHKGYGCPKCGGSLVTEDDRIRSASYRMLRVRFSNMVINGRVPNKVYRNDEGIYNHIYNELFPYWYEEYKLLPPRPLTNEIWQLDHIIPLSWFNPYNVDEMKLCWNHRNFQWLTKHENVSKHDNVRPKDLLLFTDWHYQTYNQCSYSKPLPTLDSFQIAS